MGWRWRKIINLGGGFRMSTTTRGLGWSWGIHGFRYGISPDGRKWISFGFPGTGLYYIKYLTQGKEVAQLQSEVKQDSHGIAKWKNIK